MPLISGNFKILPVSNFKLPLFYNFKPAFSTKKQWKSSPAAPNFMLRHHFAYFSTAATPQLWPGIKLYMTDGLSEPPCLLKHQKKGWRFFFRTFLFCTNHKSWKFPSFGFASRKKTNGEGRRTVDAVAFGRVRRAFQLREKCLDCGVQKLACM